MIYGYARVSTVGQARDGNSLEAQEEVLRENGATTIFKEAFTGTKKDRPQLQALLNEIKEGDRLVVTKLDRVARSATEGFEIIHSLLERGVEVHVLNMGLLDSTPTGRLITHIMLAFAEFERDMIVERTAEGKAVKRATDPNYREGRTPKTLPMLKVYQNMQTDGRTVKAREGKGMSVTEACARMGISRSTYYARLKQMENSNE